MELFGWNRCGNGSEQDPCMLIVFYIMMITQDETIKLEQLFSIVVKQEGRGS